MRVIDVADLLSAERDENAVRKDFTPSEAVAIARAIEAQLKAASKARRSAAAKLRWAHEKGEEVIRGDSPQITERPRVLAAAAVAMCDQRFRQAKEVVEAAEQEAEEFGDIVATMDTTGIIGVCSGRRKRRHRARRPDVQFASCGSASLRTLRVA